MAVALAATRIAIAIFIAIVAATAIRVSVVIDIVVVIIVVVVISDTAHTGEALNARGHVECARREFVGRFKQLDWEMEGYKI
jgi:hypothetical protein